MFTKGKDWRTIIKERTLLLLGKLENNITLDKSLFNATILMNASFIDADCLMLLQMLFMF